MGGVGSTRWGWRSTRATTDGVLALDVRVLTQRGYFAAGQGETATGIEIWDLRGEEVGRIGVVYCGYDPEVVTISYSATLPGGSWPQVHERILLERTACYYGGARRWFRCPGCDSRRAVLYCVGGIFRCRACQDLAYASTRKHSATRKTQVKDSKSPCCCGNGACGARRHA